MRPIAKQPERLSNLGSNVACIKTEPPVQVALDMLSKSLGEIGELLNTLESVLEPVLRSPEPDRNALGPEPIPDGLCKLERDILSLRLESDQLGRRLIALRDRVLV